MQDALRALIENYCTTLARQVNEIAGHIEHMKYGADALAPLGSALDLVHQISGLSGTMGYSEISTCSMELEKTLRRFEDTGQKPSTNDMAAIGEMFQTLSERAGNAVPERSTLYDADLSALSAGVR